MSKPFGGYRATKRLGVLLACALGFAGALGLSCIADAGQRVIRVGSFPYEEQLQADVNGNYSGYGYDYLQELARYTHWDYEYVKGSWGECMEMLERGEIDLMGALMRTPEREERIAFSEYPMLSGFGVLATSLDNAVLPYEDFEAFDGLRVGSLRGNQHHQNFLEYSRLNNFSPVVLTYETQEEMLAALPTGEIDAVILTNLLHSSEMRVVATFGENDGFFATTKGNTEVLAELEEGMRRIRLEDPYFNIKLDQKHYNLQTATAVSFTRDELEFIKSSPPITCTYIPAALPLSYYDEKTGTPQGVAVEICRLLEQRTGLRFVWLTPNSASEAADMLRRGHAQVMPAKYFDYNWAHDNGAQLTSPYLPGQLVMVTSGPVEQPIVALYDQGLQSQLSGMLKEQNASTREYATVLDCLDAVIYNEANTAFVNSTMASYLLGDPRYAHLKTTPLFGFSADVAMAVSAQADPRLLEVLDKSLRSISATEVNQIVMEQTQKRPVSQLATFLYFHPAEVITALTSVFLLMVLVLSILLYHRLKSNQEMRCTLYTDELTGYPNYEALTLEAPRLIGSAPARCAVVYLDIHQFKVVNDTFGYDAGDRVLVTVSKVLKDFVEANELFARIYADTFVLLLRCDGVETLRGRLDGLSERLSGVTYGSADAPLSPLFCGGVYLLPEGSVDIDKGCDRANYAKDSISQYFSNSFIFYDDLMRNRALAEKELESSMRPALARGEFIPFYQPKVDAVTSKVMGAEALVRWQHPEKGLLLPGDFLPFYEKSGFIVKIDLTIFEQVCRDLSAQLQSGKQAVPVSVNFSRRHMRDSDLPLRLKTIADCYKVPAQLLEIEVTETEQLDSMETALEFVGALKAYGFSISIDDYGTGYSSISFLQQLPFDVLKLDRNFILSAMESGKARDIMRYLVVAMQRNGIRVVCEGVETREQRDFLVGLNCRFVQGFLYSKALSLEEFSAYLDTHGIEWASDLDVVSLTSLESGAWGGSEDFLSQSMHSWVVSCLVEPGLPVCSISPGFLEEMGYSELEFFAHTDGRYLDWLSPDDRPLLLERLRVLRGTPKAPALQYRLRKKAGGYRWVRAVHKLVVDTDGREMLLGVCSDITGLIELQSEKGRLVEAVSGGVGELMLTEDGPYLEQATARFYEVLGYTPEQLEERGNSITAILAPQDREQSMAALDQLLNHDTTNCDLSLRVIDSEGGQRWISFRGTVFHTPAGPRLTVIASSDDEMARARQEAAFIRTKLEMVLTLTEHVLFEYDIRTGIASEHSGLAFYRMPEGGPVRLPDTLLEQNMIHPEDIATVERAFRALNEGQPHVSYEIRVLAPENDWESGSAYVWLRATMSSIFDEAGRPLRAVGFIENIDRQKRLEHAYVQEEQFRRAFTQSSLMAYEINLTQNTVQRISGSRGFRLIELSERMEHPGCYSEVLGAAAQLLVFEDDRERFSHEIARETLLDFYHHGVYEKELEYRRRVLDGGVLWTSALTYLSVDLLTGDVMGYVYHRDIQERKALELGLEEQAARDPLTGAYNRATAERLINDFLRRGAEVGRVQAFLMLDLNHFKEINDTYGHLIGDRCLTQLTAILTSQLRTDDIVARVGGDEFTVLLKNLPDESKALDVANSLVDAVLDMGAELGIATETGVSVGIACSPRQGSDFDTLYQLADDAMYEAKRSPKLRVSLSGHREPVRGE